MIVAYFRKEKALVIFEAYEPIDALSLPVVYL